jgi:hypothetical protein
MPAGVFERLTGFKSEQNSSQGSASEREYSDLSYGEPTNEYNSATIILHDQNDGRRFAGRSGHYIKNGKCSEAEYYRSPCFT